ncbi:Ryanodine receptor 44F-like X1 [Oopsacas minuta]|uniref:Ryanodine receptor 44F-like X1 n=1 Tax=Oopsacas minuta TaxID=111878 RepID=A0AAV7K8I1_9METZ|nr:Ryanodine receptor 44F-like X1 [Oopsacas minuta]
MEGANTQTGNPFNATHFNLEIAGYLRTEDIIYLNCKSKDEQYVISSDGFGSSEIFLGAYQDKFPLWKSAFIIEQATSVHMLNTKLYHEGCSKKTKPSQTGSTKIHKTLTYGNAIILRHLTSKKYLACQPRIGNQSDYKLRFVRIVGDGCWFIVLPGNTASCIGDKVKTGDGALLKNHLTERYIYHKMDEKVRTFSQSQTDAPPPYMIERSRSNPSQSRSIRHKLSKAFTISEQFEDNEYIGSKELKKIELKIDFKKTIWRIMVLASSDARDLYQDYLSGEDYIQIHSPVKGYLGPEVGGEIQPDQKQRDLSQRKSLSCLDEFLSKDYIKEDQPKLVYKQDTSGVGNVWRVETIKSVGGKWGASFVRWQQAFNLVNVVTGTYLAYCKEKRELCLVKLEEIGEENHTCDTIDFKCLSICKSKMDITGAKTSTCTQNTMTFPRGKDEIFFDEEEFSPPQIKFAESSIILLADTEQMPCVAFDTFVTEQKESSNIATTSQDHKYIFSLNFSLVPSEKAYAANLICVTEAIVDAFKCLRNETLKNEFKNFYPIRKNLRNMLSDLMSYLDPQRDNTWNEVDSRDPTMKRLSLRAKQTLFSSEGILLEFPAILAYLQELRLQIRMEVKRDHLRMINELTRDILEVIALMIEGNPENCQKLVRKDWLDIFFDLLEIQAFFEGVLKVLHLAVQSSPTVLTLFSENIEYFDRIFNLLEKFGRNERVLDLLSALCVHEGVAIRRNQDNITKLLLGSNIRNSLFLKTYSIEIVDFFRPNLFLHYVPNSASYTEWFFEVEFKSTSDHNEEALHARVGWAYVEYFKTEPTIIAYESNTELDTEPVKVGVGSDLTSFGFDGQFMWIGGNKYQVEELMDENLQILHEPITIGCYIDMQKGRAWFFLNGKQVNISITGIVPEEYITPVVSLRGQVQAVVRLGKEFGNFKYPPPQHLFKPAPLCDARLSINDSLKMEKWVCPDQMDNRQLDIITPDDPLPKGVVTLSSPISPDKFNAYIPIQVQDLEPMTPSTSIVDGRRKSLPNFQIAFQLGSKKQDLAEFLHDAWSEKCLSLDYKWGEVTDPIKKTMRELDHFDKLDEHDQEEYIVLAEALIDGLNKYDCNINVLNWKYERPRERSEVYKPLHYSLANHSKPHWNRYHDAISRQLAEYVHNQLCLKKIQRGWRYGYEMNEQLKLHPSLRPLESFEQTTLTYLRLRHLINSTIQLVLASNGGNLELKHDEETKTGLEESKGETRFTTFKVSNQFAVSYKENGNNRWYFEAIIKSEGQIRVGWATTDATPGIPLGDDKHSYAFSGYCVACKCHNNTESFGRTWKKDSVLGCFLDLNDGTIIFSLDGQFLRSSSNVKNAFTNIPINKRYLPAVSLGPEQRVILNFGQKQDSLQMLQRTFEQPEVFTPFGEGIICQIPIYISQRTNDSVRIEKSGTQPVRILDPQKQWKTPPPIKLQLRKKTRMLYMSLNMGICPLRAGEERFSFSVSIPNLDNRQAFERGYIGFTTSHFTQMNSQYQLRAIGETHNPGPVYSLDKECLAAGIVGEENTPGELISFYLVPLSTFIDQFTNEKPQAVHTNFLRVSCIMDLITRNVLFYLDEDFICEIPIKNLNFFLYPSLLYAGNQGDIIEFDFNPFRECSPFIHGLLDPEICGDNVFTERMHLRVSTPHKWSNLELNSNRFSIHLERDEGISINSKLSPYRASLMDSENYEDNAFPSVGEDLPRRFSRIYNIDAELTHLEEDTFEFFPYEIPKFDTNLNHPNKNMHLLIPEESCLISLMDTIENKQLIEFYTKTILLLISVCDKDFIKAKEMVLDYVGFQHLLSSLELGIQQLIPVQLSLAIYKLCIALFLEAEYNLKAMTRRESLIEMMTEPPQIITVLPRDPTINDFIEERESVGSMSGWHFSYGSQLLAQLKGMVFAKLWEIMSVKLYTCSFLKDKKMREGVLMPLLNVIKHLVLTEKLDPKEYTWLMLIIEPKYKAYICDETRNYELPFKEGLLGILDLEDSVKYEICSILDYLYDLHIRRQVYKTVHFMMNISNDIKQKQEEKMEHFKNQPHHPSGRELRQPPSQQIEYFLEQVTQCGVDKFYEMPIEKLKNYFLYFKSTFECRSKYCEDSYEKQTDTPPQMSDDITTGIAERPNTKLRDSIIEGLLGWARQIADNHPLREIIFSLVRRYVSRVEEFRDVLARTYVLPKSSKKSETSSSETSRAAEILGALGHLRSVLNIKLNQQDETRLTLAIGTLTNANVLFQYPDSLFILGVYEAVLNVMEHILRECLPKQVQSKLKKRISVKFGTLRKIHSFGITQNTFACCIHFLCSLIRYFPLFSIHSSNSTDVFFSELDKLIELSFIYVHSTKKDALSSPLEVVNSLIKQNEKLTLSLKESQINQILEFLTNTLFKVPDSKLRKLDSEYQFRHGLCYLEFLKYAVSSQEKYIETNAKIVVMYFINHKETIDQALLNFFSKQTLASEPELMFYTNFLDLLGRCAPPRKYEDGVEEISESQNNNENLQFRKKTCLLLQNFISEKLILEFLSMKGHQLEDKWMLYKSALIAILDRIHGITEPQSTSESKTDTERDQLGYPNTESRSSFLELVDGPFLCDLSRALLKHQFEVSDTSRDHRGHGSFREEPNTPLQDLTYIMSAVLPVITKGFHNIHRLLLTNTETHILNSTLYATYWISFLIPEKLSGRYKKPLAEFFSEFAIVIPPFVMCNFFRCITSDISHMRLGTAQVLFKFFQQHLEHYQSYYNQTNSELQGRAKLPEQEDLITLFFQLLYYLLKNNDKVTPKELAEDHPIIPTLIALSGCISPMTLTKTQIDDLLSDINNIEATHSASFDADIISLVVPKHSFLPFSYYNRNQKRDGERRRMSLRRGAIRYNQLEEKLHPYGEKFWEQVKGEIAILNEELESLEDPNKYSRLMSELVDCLDQENLTVSTLKERERDNSSTSIFSLQSSDGESSLPLTRTEVPRRDTSYKTLKRMSSTNSFQHQYKDEFTERLSRHLYFWVCGPHSAIASPVASSLPTSAHDVEHMPFEILLSKKRHALKVIINYFFQLLDYIGLRVRRGPNSERVGSNFLFGTEEDGVSPKLQRFSLRLLRGTKVFLEKTTGDDPAYRAPSSLQDIDESGSAFVTQPKKSKSTYSADNLKFFLKVLIPILNRHFHLHKVYYLKSGRVFYQVTATAQESDELSNLFSEFVTHLPKIPLSLEPSNRSIFTLKLKVFLRRLSDAIEVTPKMAEEVGADGTYNLSLYMRSGSHIMELVSKRTGEYSSWINISCTLTIMLPFFINLFRKIGTSLEEDVVEYFDNLEESIRDKIKPYLKILYNSLMKIAIQSELQNNTVMKEQIGTCIGLLTQVAPHAIFKEKMESYGVNVNTWLDSMSRSELIGNIIFPNYIHLPILSYTLAKYGRDPEIDPLKFQKWVDQFIEEAFNCMLEKVRLNRDFILLWIETHIEKIIIWCSPEVFWRKFLEVISEVRIHLLQVYNADKAEQHKIQTQSQNKTGYTNIDNKYFQTMYKIVAQQYITTISLLWRYITKDNIREEVERREVNDKFVSLLIILMEIFAIWCESQSFKKECLSLVKLIKDLIVFEDSMLLGVIFTEMEINTNYPLERRSGIVLILRRILHFGKAIPFIEKNECLINEGVKLLQEGKSQHAVSDLIREEFAPSEPKNPKQGTFKNLTCIANNMLSRSGGDHIQLFMKEFILMKHRLNVMANHTSPGASKWKWLRHKQIIRNMIKFLASKQLCKMANFRVTNHLIQGYRLRVLSGLESNQNLIRNLVQSNVSCPQNVSGASLEHIDFQPIAPLVSLLEVPAKTTHEEQLYLEYTRYMFQACDDLWSELDETDDTMDDERDPTEVEDRKYRRIALEKLQEKLNHLEVPQMVIKVLINCRGIWSASIYHCLQLGIAILRGGNEDVQESMLTFITKTCPKETPLFRNISKLITSSTVLDLELFNRGKAIMTHGHIQSKINALGHYEYTIALFRFLQLLCEGHNASFQEYLHTQAGKSTTVNLVQITVDYLLLMQESISSFCWHYNNMDHIEAMGQDNISCAFSVIKQVLITLTEYIQGPCKLNQTALSRSRLWDAIQGLLRLFAYLQEQLSNTNSIELLREVLKVLSDMIILLLSMLEGNQMSSEIGVSMKHTLVDCRNELQDITKFCFMFIKLNDTLTSKAFTQYDTNKDGRISRLEFERSLQTQKQYSPEEVDYLMRCGDTNRDGYIDYAEFLDRFLLRAEEIGFNLVVLLQNLFEHLPKTNSDFELNDLRNRGKELMEYFNNHLGSIEIIGKSRTVEKVYFQIPKSCRDQWARSQIQESKREFINTCDHENVNSKLDKFIDFSENTIFEMRHFGKLCQVEEWERESRAKSHRDQNIERFREITPGPQSQEYTTRNTIRTSTYSGTIKAKCLWIFLTVIHIILWCGKNVGRLIPKRYRKKKCTEATPKTCWLKGEDTCMLPGEDIIAAGDCVELEPSHLMREAKQYYETSKIIPVGFSDEYVDLKNKNFSRLRKLKQYMRDLTQLTHYWPLIIQSNFRLSSFLVENEQMLKSLRFFSVIFMNFLLLFYYQSDQDMFAYDYQIYLVLTASLHVMLSLLLLYTYIMWKVPLECFKREKKICIEILQNSDIFKSFLDSNSKPFLSQYWWDAWALKSDKFPRMYWDKHFKHKVRENYSEMDRDEEIDELLGENMERNGENNVDEEDNYRSLNEYTHGKFGVDYYYAVWMLFRVYLSDKNLLFSLMYICFTCMGLLFDHFFFAFHLIPEMMGYFSTLRTVVVSVTIHGKRLVYTTLLMSAVIFIYTVFAFRFFTTYYSKNCTNMVTCLQFHMSSALRSGGGVSDVIDTPDKKDPLVLPRFLFDMSFFFIVIVFLLAIIQGLIIDAFGELRDREEGVRASMQNKCFICGINKDKFNQVPRGYEKHTSKEHYYPNYLFFLMYLINKHDTLYTGQESYVWDLYLQRKWDFFPIGCYFEKNSNEKHEAEQLVA